MKDGPFNLVHPVGTVDFGALFITATIMFVSFAGTQRWDMQATLSLSLLFRHA